MPRFIKANKEEVGMSPDAFIFRGTKKTDKISLKIMDYDEINLFEGKIDNIKQAVKYDKTSTTSWLNVDGLHDSELMKNISEQFSLSPLILSDVMNPHNRPKIYEYDNCIYISIRMLHYNELTELNHSEFLAFIIKKNILLSFQETQGSVFEPIRDRIRRRRKKISSSGTDYLAVAIIDAVFENYNYIISRVGEKIEALDEKLIDNMQSSIIEEINYFKREIIFLQKIIKPCFEVVLNLEKLDSDLINNNLWVHIKDLKESIQHANESLESYRAILSDQLNVYHTNVSSKLNDTMKLLTVFSVFFIPLTFIVGVYGTNFKYIPETNFEYGYFFLWGVMLLISAVMVYFFRKNKWF